MIINELIGKLVYEQAVSVDFISAETDINKDKLLDILNLKITATPREAEKILKALGVKLEEVLMVY